MHDKPKLLIVEDDMMVRMVLHETLEAEGYAVSSFETPSQALAAIKEHNYCMVLSDLRLPEMSGMDLLDEIRKAQPNAVRILITGYSNMATLAEGINRGLLFRFISKPWTREELLTTIQSAKDHYDLEQSHRYLQEETRALNESLASVNAELRLVNHELHSKIDELEQQKNDLNALSNRLNDQVEHTLELCYQLQEKNNPILAIRTKARVELARGICKNAPFDDEEKRCLINASWLCDLGMIGLPSALIDRYNRKPEKLSSDEITQVQNHPIVSQQLATLIDKSSTLSNAIRSHHERHDGTGFPDGLAGDRVPVMARLLAVIVHFAESEADNKTILKEIEAKAGSDFHPDAVRSFFRYANLEEPPSRMREVVFDELEPGMRLANGIYGPTGLMLVAKDRVLDENTIRHIRNYNQRNPLHQRIFVYR
ncbi:MAG: response regulator [Opitutales bacterium]|nr:response regulator [Opitutales bacterium]